MALPAGVTYVTNIKGDKGDKGDVGSITAASATSVAADAPATAVVSGPPSARTVAFQIPRGLPGVNAVGNDAAVATYVGADGSATRVALDGRYSSKKDTARASLMRAQFENEGAARLRALGSAASIANQAKGELSYSVISVTPPTAATQWLLNLPANYDARLAVPLIIWLHNAGGTAFTPDTNAGMQPFMNKLVEAGHAVLRVSVGSTWANDAARAEIIKAYLWATANYNIAGVGLVGVSMGGDFALNFLTRNEIPNVLFYVGIGAVASLANLYTASYKPAIDAAFGVTSINDIPDRYKPETYTGDQLRGVPIMLIHSPGDNTCAIANAQIIIDKSIDYGADSVLITSSGSHIEKPQFDDAITYAIPFIAKHAPVGKAVSVDPWDTHTIFEVNGSNLGADGTAISPWTGLVGGVNLTRSDAAQRPLVASQGGIKYAHFDGVDDTLGHLTFVRPIEYTEIIIYRMWGALDSNRRRITSSGSNSPSDQFTVGSSGTSVDTQDRGVNANLLNAPSDSSWHIGFKTGGAKGAVIRRDDLSAVLSGGGIGARSVGMYAATAYGGISGATAVDLALWKILDVALTGRQMDAVVAKYRTDYAPLFA